MSGNPVAKATGGRPKFTPRRRKPAVIPLTETTQLIIPASLPVPAGKTEPPQSPSPVTNTLHKVNGHALAPAEPQKLSWQALSRQDLWLYFIKIRELYHTKKPALGTPLATRYLAIREQLFHLYLPDVIATAKSYKRRKMPQSSLTDIDDLEQVASIAMLLLLDKYDPTFGDGNVTFMGYANANEKSRVQGAMTDTLRSLQEFPRPVAFNRRKLMPKIREVRSNAGHSVTIEEVLDTIGWQHRSVITDPLFNAGVFNQSQIIGSDDETWESGVLQLCEARPPLPTKSSSAEIEERILSVIKDDDVRQVIRYYYFDGNIFKEIAALKKCKESRISTLHKKGIAIIKENFSREVLKELVLRGKQ